MKKPIISILTSARACSCVRCGHEWTATCVCFRRTEPGRGEIPRVFHEVACGPPGRCPKCGSRTWTQSEAGRAGRPKKPAA